MIQILFIGSVRIQKYTHQKATSLRISLS
ncbi:unnamed protein product, partial [Rotaria sp. Silwood2]